MRKGSLVQYIGGQCSYGRRMCPLSEEQIYTLSSDVITGLFKGVPKEAVELEEIEGWRFTAAMFKEIQEPMSIGEILKESLSLT